MRTVDIETTAYPRMKTNLTDKQVIERYTLLPEEIQWVRNYRGDVLALAVRMKCSEHLMNHNFSLADIPQKVIDYIASQLQVAPFLLDERKNPRFEQIQLIRKYTGFSPFLETEREKLGGCLTNVRRDATYQTIDSFIFVSSFRLHVANVAY